MKFHLENEHGSEKAAPTAEYRLREQLAELEQRLDRLERVPGRGDPRRWVLPALGAGALVVLVALSTRSGDLVRIGSVAPSLEARAFVLKDEEGVQRAALDLRDDGEASLTLTDANGLARLRVAVMPDGSPGVSLLDTDGETRAILGLLSDGTTTLVFADGGSVPRGIFGLTPDGAARILFNDKNGRTRTAVGVDTEGQPEVSRITGSEMDAGSRSVSGDSQHEGAGP